MAHTKILKLKFAARAVLFAVCQPIELNIFDMEDHPQKSLKL